jgi:hypothetical protein
VSERYPRTSNRPEDQGDDHSESRYTPSSHSRPQHLAVSRSARLPVPLYDFEERTPSNYPRFQDIGYTGDRSGDSGGMTRGEYEAIYGVPKSKRGVSRSQMSVTSSQREREFEERQPEDYTDSSRSNAGPLMRIPIACERY